MNIYEEIEQRHKNEAKDILENLLNNRSVHRLDAYDRRVEIKSITDKTDKYDSIMEELFMLQDLAKETL